MNPASTALVPEPSPFSQHGAMKGFHTEFKNLEDYIRVITDRIWEGRRIEDIVLYYSDPCVVETPSSVSSALQTVIDGTLATLAMFPDRRLLAEDVIQSGDADGGYLSSHRIISPMTHLGQGLFGEATGRKIHVRTIADCVCKDNRIVHEWLVRDQAAIAYQIGSTPRALAQTWLNQRGGWSKPIAGPAPSGYASFMSQHADAEAYATTLQALAAGDERALQNYDEAIHQISPGNMTQFGHAEVKDFWMDLFGSMAVQYFEVEHLAHNSGSGRADRVAIRWRAQALHTGGRANDSRYGKLTGKPVELLGINHAEIVNGKILREWVLLDDVALWMQVLSQQT